MIGLGMRIESIAEFNRRAAIALNGVTFKADSQQLRFVKTAIAAINTGFELDTKQQQALYNLVHRYRRHITDRMVTEFAAMRAKGAD